MKPKTAGKIQEREHIIQGLDSDCSPISKEWANGLPSGDEVEKQFPNPKGITKSDSEVKAMYNRRKGANWMKQIASAIIAKKDDMVLELRAELQNADKELGALKSEKEELETKLNLAGIDNENLRIEVQFLKKENDDLADKYGKSVEENLDLKEKLIELRKENEQLKSKTQ